jgi:DNA repair protein RadD
MLRKYQQDAVDSLFRFNKDRPGDSSVIVVPTGGGKTRIMAEIIRRSFEINPSCRGMIITHVKELIEQSNKTCLEFATEDTGLSLDSIGVYSSSIGRKEVKPLTIAGIQSVHKRADIFGSLDFILVDEAHLISSNKETMYRKFISAVKIKNSRVNIVGLTATPYRLQSGKIFGAGKTFDDVCYIVDLDQLISDGYLCPIHSFGSQEIPNLKKVKIRGGEYLLSDLEKAVEDEALVARGVWDAIRKSKGRNSILVFAITINHANMIMESLKRNGQPKCELITGDTPKELREFKIEQFKKGEIRWLVNVSVLTTGFDAPNIDCIVIMRPTMSKGLYCQKRLFDFGLRK